MTDNEIFELASKHLCYFEDSWRGTEWSGKPEELLKFVRAIYEEGYEQHRKDIMGEGYYD